jgi:hypothetical protein
MSMLTRISGFAVECKGQIAQHFLDNVPTWSYEPCALKLFRGIVVGAIHDTTGGASWHLTH